MKKFLLFIWLLLPALSFCQFGDFIDAEISDNHAQVFTENGQLELALFDDDILQVTFLYNSEDNLQLSNAVIAEAIQTTIEQKALPNGHWQVNIGQFTAEISATSVDIYNNNEGIHKSFIFSKNENNQSIRFDIAKEEQFYGAGERAVDVNLRGRKLLLYNEPHYGYGYGTENLNYCVPTISSNQGYFLFFDNPQKGYFDIGKTNADEFEFSTIGGEMTFYLIAESDYVSQVEKLMTLVGTQPLPPRWAFGHLQSRFGYKNQQEALEITNQMLAEDFPVDAVIFDLYWFGKGKHGAWNMGNLDWDRENFPEPEKMINELSKKNLKTILITEPFVLQESTNYEFAAQNGLLATDSLGNAFVLQDFYFGKGGILDVFKPEAQDWVWQQYKKEIERGIAGWWVDLAEPEKHPSGMIHDIGTADEIHNIYGHYWDKMLFDKYAEEYPNMRLFNLNRSGYAGSGRYGVFPWTGDVSRSWNGLQSQVPQFLSMSMSGVPYIHSDAGGFAMGEYDSELYTRWLQLSVFSPIFRPHGGVIEATDTTKYLAPEPIFWDKTTKQRAKELVELRYQMMPYNYTLALQQQEFGTPLMRPVVSEKGNILDGQYYWGDWFLVAPIVEQGTIEKQVYFPTGKWFNPHTKKWLAGGKNITITSTLNQAPYFIKAGAIVPMKPIFRNTEEYPDELIIHYYPSEQQTTFTIYEDDGKTNGSADKGLYNLLDVKAVKKENYTRMTICTLNGKYNGKPEVLPLKIMIHDAAKPKKVKEKNYDTNYTYDKTNKELSITINWDGEQSIDLMVK